LKLYRVLQFLKRFFINTLYLRRVTFCPASKKPAFNIFVSMFINLNRVSMKVTPKTKSMEHKQKFFIFSLLRRQAHETQQKKIRLPIDS